MNTKMQSTSSAVNHKITFNSGQEYSQMDLHFFSPDEPPVLPLWINGRALLTCGDGLVAIKSPNGKVLRKVPLCSVHEAAEALSAARAAFPSWQAMNLSQRAIPLAAVAQTLCGSLYADHFARLLVEEPETRGQNASKARAAVNMVRDDFEALARQSERQGDQTSPNSATYIDLLPTNGLCPETRDGNTVVIRATEKRGFAACAGIMARHLMAGNAVIVLPLPTNPSALLALVELWGREGLPAGLASVLYGSDALETILLSHPV